MKRIDLISYLADYLAVNNFEDYAPNGLQIEGKDTVELICTAVTASHAAIEQAAAMQADALLVHHGFFWRGESSVITGMKKRRIKALMDSNINLLAYHLPLDCHSDLGNNACFADLLDVQSVEKTAVGKTPNLLWSGQLSRTWTVQDFSDLIAEKLKRTPMTIACSDRPIQSIAWCTGAAQDFIEQAHYLGVDAYLSGEISERTYYQAQELGLHYFACGHHASERLGIRALGQHLSAQFGLRHYFIDGDNPV